MHVPPIETHLIPSKRVAQTFKIQVMRPCRRSDDTRRSPVVYAMDGNWVFDMFKSIAYLIQMSEMDAPPFMLVGVSYPSENPHAGYMLRMRDLTAPPFPEWPNYAESWQQQVFVPHLEGVLEPEKGTKAFFGADDFQGFLADELIPFIDDSYETIPGDRTYHGHSAGGFFGVYTLFTRSRLFKNYIISSPGLSCHGVSKWGERFDNYDFGLQMLRDFVVSGRSLEGVKVYLSAGADEEFEPVMSVWRITSTVERFAKALREAMPDLDLMTEIIPGESHKTVWPIGFTHGVQAVFGTRRVSRSLYDQARRGLP
jgi:hypothetical protein